MGVLEETDTLAVRTIDFGLADVDDLGVLIEFGIVELGVQAQDYGGGFLHYK